MEAASCAQAASKLNKQTHSIISGLLQHCAFTVAPAATAMPTALGDDLPASTLSLQETLSLAQEQQSSRHLVAPTQGNIKTPFSKAFDSGANWALGDDDGQDAAGGFTRPTFQLDIAEKVFRWVLRQV